MKTYCQKFIDLYNRLDEMFRERLGCDARVSHAKLIEQMATLDPVVAGFASRLHAFRSLRNAVVHMATDGTESPIAEPLAEIVDEYQRMVNYIETPPRALDTIATGADIVAKATWNDPLFPKLSFLDEQGFDTLPVVESNVLEGIYTLRILQGFLVDLLKSNGFDLSKELTLDVFRGRAGFNREDPENEKRTVPCVAIVSKEATIEEVELLYRECAKHHEFLSVVCITERGRVFEPLRGIVTPANLPSANPEAFSKTMLNRS